MYWVNQRYYACYRGEQGIEPTELGTFNHQRIHPMKCIYWERHADKSIFDPPCYEPYKKSSINTWDTKCPPCKDDIFVKEWQNDHPGRPFPYGSYTRISPPSSSQPVQGDHSGNISYSTNSQPDNGPVIQAQPASLTPKNTPPPIPYSSQPSNATSTNVPPLTNVQSKVQVQPNCSPEVSLRMAENQKNVDAATARREALRRKLMDEQTARRIQEQAQVQAQEVEKARNRAETEENAKDRERKTAKVDDRTTRLNAAEARMSKSKQENEAKESQRLREKELAKKAQMEKDRKEKLVKESAFLVAEAKKCEEFRRKKMAEEALAAEKAQKAVGVVQRAKGRENERMQRFVDMEAKNVKNKEAEDVSEQRLKAEIAKSKACLAAQAKREKEATRAVVAKEKEETEKQKVLNKNKAGIPVQNKKTAKKAKFTAAKAIQHADKKVAKRKKRRGKN